LKAKKAPIKSGQREEEDVGCANAGLQPTNSDSTADGFRQPRGNSTRNAITLFRKRISDVNVFN
jgi:outer membrane cobalamin receptor